MAWLPGEVAVRPAEAHQAADVLGLAAAELAAELSTLVPAGGRRDPLPQLRQLLLVLPAEAVRGINDRRRVW
jgi:hypothetical protein